MPPRRKNRMLGVLMRATQPLWTTTHLCGPANLGSVPRDVATSPADPSVAYNFHALAPASVRLRNHLFAHSTRRGNRLQCIGVILLRGMSVSENSRFKIRNPAEFSWLLARSNCNFMPIKSYPFSIRIVRNRKPSSFTSVSLHLLKVQLV